MTQFNALPEVWQQAAQQFNQIVALHDPHSKPEVKLTYSQLYQQMQQLAAGLQALGMLPDSKIAIFADNSPRWFIADQGSIMAGAANAVRSATAEPSELLYILADSHSHALIVENLKTLQKLEPDCYSLPLAFVVLLTDETPPSDAPIKILNFAQLMELGANSPFKPVNQTKNTLATLIYTSGTTGQPKGVMLSHGNLLHQITAITTFIRPQPGDRALSILPSWHSYERSCEYFLLSQGCTQIYTSIRTFKSDLKQFAPQHMVGVPRLWESLYEAIQKQLRDQGDSQYRLVQFFFNLSERYILARRIANNKSLNHLHASAGERLSARLQSLLLSPLHALGDKLVYQKIRQGVGGEIQTLVSGGGSLAMHLDNFYEIVNIPLLVGYGLTETSPVTNARRYEHNLRGSSGQPLLDTEIRIVDPDTRQSLPPEARGLVLIRGPQVMQGYYQKPEATAKAIDPDGWFDSGDLGWITPMGDLVITGRAKDTIVLSNGENIEPQPIEDACARSPYIAQIMLVGQDQKSLGALIVPNLEALEKWVLSQQLALKIPQPDEVRGSSGMSPKIGRDTRPIGDSFSSRSLSDASSSEIASSDLYSQAVLDLFKQELKREVQNRPGYRSDDQIKVFKLILEAFSLENGMMTQTLKIKRPVVSERYRDTINEMF